ncbi:hypothetical protein Nepgr_022751 [Nepenthes gracilis]|uniref:Reverse transcriptase RNase H-like domain-containing protein n=1 Tax=Nepenthes gracilis TaxID=150966 RepID=A0AAD3XYE1_NEPGR|nr:hypothetical protein Nepgr_022751 [Nepenthes gracilis]
MSPKDGDELYLYLAVSKVALSSVLVRQDTDTQWPVYYVNKTLIGLETHYLRAEELVLALVFSAQKLRPYFQEHRVIVLTNQPLKSTL